MMYILVSVAAVIAILARTSGLDASSETIAQRYLNFFTVSSFFSVGSDVLLYSIITIRHQFCFASLISMP